MTSDLINNQILNNLSDSERELAIKILEEYSDNGKSFTLYKLQMEDYNELPVDIETFITDDKYLGKAWKDGNGKLKIYPFWLEQLKKLFPDNLSIAVNNFIESGARGLGKSEIAAGVIAPYLIYRVMCLKNPLQYFGLKPTEKICFAFMNITKTLAEEIAVDKFQKTIQLSPWFMSKGRLTQLNNAPYWEPPEPISIIIGSQSSHVIGQPIYFCLDGDTKIYTDTGIYRIGDLVDKTIRVPSINECGNIQLSDFCTVKPTATCTDEYEITLEDNTVIKCTPNHRFMLKDGTYKEAQYLTEDDELVDLTIYGYVYKVTNNVNGKIYIGQKHSDKFLKEEYLGSGTNIKKAISKYGKENFTVELLCWCDCKAHLDDMEKLYISLYNSTNSDIGYNIADGGQGGNLGKDITKKISTTLKGHYVSSETREKLSKANIGKHLSEETKQKISASNKNKQVSAETKQKMSISAKQLDRSNYKTNAGKICINDGVNVRFVSADSSIPTNWVRGNCATAKSHDMSKYYSNKEMQNKNSQSKSGSNNSMYRNGYRISGGKNGKAVTDYWYKDLYFDCRKALLNYLKSNIDNSISDNLLRNIEHGNYKTRTINKYSWLISDLRWRNKDEN